MTSSQDASPTAETRAYLGERGIPLAGPQQTKTKTALEFFAAEIAAGGA